MLKVCPGSPGIQVRCWSWACQAPWAALDQSCSGAQGAQAGISYHWGLAREGPCSAQPRPSPAAAGSSLDGLAPPSAPGQGRVLWVWVPKCHLGLAMLKAVPSGAALGSRGWHEGLGLGTACVRSVSHVCAWGGACPPPPGLAPTLRPGSTTTTLFKGLAFLTGQGSEAGKGCAWLGRSVSVGSPCPLPPQL